MRVFVMLAVFLPTAFPLLVRCTLLRPSTLSAAVDLFLLGSRSTAGNLLCSLLSQTLLLRLVTRQLQ